MKNCETENMTENIMKKIWYLFLQGFLFFLSYIIPKKDNLILLGSGGGNDFEGNPKYLFLYLLKNKKRLHFYWIKVILSA